MEKTLNTKLQTGILNARNVGQYIFQEGGLSLLSDVLQRRPKINLNPVLFIVDEFFQDGSDVMSNLPIRKGDSVISVSTKDEPTTEHINELYESLLDGGLNAGGEFCAIVGVGGGATLDTAKAVSNLLGNGGKAEDYQGWDLLQRPGVFKIGIPTVSGTGAEATRTCVMTSRKSGLKLGMNSDFSVFNQLILDPTLTATVPRRQYFFSGMDAFIHCIEALSGSYRNPIGDALSEKSLDLCRQVFLSDDMKADENRAKLMVASYLGGCAIATSYVGVVHPFSAGLSVVLGLHHGIANCIALNGLKDFYIDAHRDLNKMLEKQQVELPQAVCNALDQEDFDRLYDATIMHEKPLINALGSNFRNILTRERVFELFSRM